MKIGVIYWSGTGNTEMMANAIAEGVKAGGADAEVMNVSEPTAEAALGYDALALGCPAMGAEQLEEDEFEPMFAECEGKLNGKKIALFGSYGWGDGEWMRSWEDTCPGGGAVMACDTVICNGAPDAGPGAVRSLRQSACVEKGGRARI